MIRNFLFASLILTSVNGYTQNTNDALQKPISMDSLFKAKERESIGKLFPEFSVVVNDRLISKDYFKGKIIFINFWFEACPPCIAELPALNELYRKFSANKNFEFLSFTYESPGRVLLLKKKYHISYKVASISNQECYRLNQNNGFPTSIILGETGIIKDLFTGGSTDKEEAKEFITNTVYQSIINALKN